MLCVTLIPFINRAFKKTLQKNAKKLQFYLAVTNICRIFTVLKQLNNYEMKAEIKESVLQGKDFENDQANWFTINRINIDGKMAIWMNDEYTFYNTVDKFTNAIVKLINTGSL